MAEALSLFTFIFLSALPGRTTFILIMLSVSGKKWPIFWGAALAFLIQVFISILAGEVLALVPTSYIQLGAGMLFLLFARKFWSEAQKPTEVIDTHVSISIKTVFTLIFAAELGDVSQLAIATSAAQTTSKLLVFCMSVMALWLITALAVVFGGRLGHFLKPKVLQKIASIAFCAIGAYLCLTGIVKMFE